MGRFVQYIEGLDEPLQRLLADIRHDLRHSELAVVRDRKIAERQFGNWRMERISSVADLESRLSEALHGDPQVDRTLAHVIGFMENRAKAA